MAHSKVTRSSSSISARETVSSGKPGTPLRQKAAGRAVPASRQTSSARKAPQAKKLPQSR